MAKEINYEVAYNALLEMCHAHMSYNIEQLTDEEGFDGCLLTGCCYYLGKFAPFVKKYGYDVIEKIVNDIAQGGEEDGEV